jgi:hypothetical protein
MNERPCFSGVSLSAPSLTPNYPPIVARLPYARPPAGFDYRLAPPGSAAAGFFVIVAQVSEELTKAVGEIAADQHTGRLG